MQLPKPPATVMKWLYIGAGVKGKVVGEDSGRKRRCGSDAWLASLPGLDSRWDRRAS